MQPDDLLSVPADVVAKELGGELVLLHLGSGTYFGLNPVGGRIWQLLEEGDRSLASLCEAICAEFDAPRDVIETDIRNLAADLLEHGLLEVAAA